jgi:hypothetical protein
MVAVGIALSNLAATCLTLALNGAGNRVYEEAGIMALVGIGLSVLANGFLNG